MSTMNFAQIIHRQVAINAIAKVCHEANRAYCQTMGDGSQLPWAEAPDWQKDSAYLGVKMLLDNPDAGPGAAHVSWRDQKEAEGWVYGAVKDPEQKTHPCLVDFTDLPPDQQAKDHLFVAVARALLPFLST